MDLTSRFMANPSEQRARNPVEKDEPNVLSQIMSNPDVLSAMAGIRSRMDPEGAGGFLGGPAQEMLQSRAMAQEAERQSIMMKKLVEALGGRPGSVKVDPQGGVNIKVDSEKGGSDLQTPQDKALGDITTPSNMENVFNLGSAGALEKLSDQISIFGRR